jgi:hypothetical protein
MAGLRALNLISMNLYMSECPIWGLCASEREKREREREGPRDLGLDSKMVPE